jgi:hypothetical protein
MEIGGGLRYRESRASARGRPRTVDLSFIDVFALFAIRSREATLSPSENHLWQGMRFSAIGRQGARSRAMRGSPL